MDTIDIKSDNIKNPIKVKDLETVINLIKKMYSVQPENKMMVSTLQELIIVLHPYRNKDANEFIQLLKTSLGDKKISKQKEIKDDLKNISYEDFIKASRSDLNKDVLIHLAHRFFKISISRMKRLSKNDVLDLIDDSIENRETLEAISRRASK